MIDKLTKKIKKIIPENLSIFDLFPFVFILVICFLLFQHTDLLHTTKSSYAYLNGHFADFYDYNLGVVGGNSYLPLIYIIFAIWNIPLKILGLMNNDPTTGINIGTVELVWAKLLLVVLYFASAYIIYLIARSISGQSQKAKYIAVIFATSPIAIFDVFIFGQYDILGIFFTMVGFYYYIKNDYTKFSLFFSLAISIKYFPLIIFIPLLLLIEKRVIHIIKYIFIALSATLFQIFLYYRSSIFMQEYFSLASGKLNGVATLNLSSVNNSPYLFVMFAIICIYAYIKEVDQVDKKNKNAIFISVLSYALLFSTTVWHPQWIIIIVPFFTLAYLYIKDESKSFLIDLIGMLSYIYIVVNIWPGNVDSNLLGSGLMRAFFTYIPLTNAKIFYPPFLSFFMGIFFVYLISPLIVQLFQKENKKIDIGNDNSKTNKYFRSRLYFGISIFVFPSLFCALVPKDIARKMDPIVFTYSGPSISLAEIPVGNINSNTKIKQSFIAEYDYLYSIGVDLSTWDRINDCKVTLTLLDEKNTVVATQIIDGKTLVDNAFYIFSINPVENSKGKKYYIEISSDGTYENSITAWRTINDIYEPGKLYINGKEEVGDLCIFVYYDIPEKTKL
ncbi:MAG: glycosyltransferase 87 family protein [Chloroflexi bacterium]|nr:glycosyltransferase 87 family protein [Chloroflexota bacterium]